MTRTQRRRESTAYHEAGHAFLAFRSGLGIRSVSIVPETETGSNGRVTNDGGFARDRNFQRYDIICDHCAGEIDLLSFVHQAKLRDNADLAKHEIRALFAGDEAVRHLRGRRNSYGARNDYALIQSMLDIEFVAMDERARRALRRALQLEARYEIISGWRHVTALAHALLESNVLDHQQTMGVILKSHVTLAKEMIYEDLRQQR